MFSFVAAGTDRAAVAGKLVIKGKSLSFDRAWLVRGLDTFDQSKSAAYLILASEDISAAVAACEDIHCVVWNVVKDGAVLEPSDDGHESFWLRVVSPKLEKEQQLSGAASRRSPIGMTGSPAGSSFPIRTPATRPTSTSMRRY